MFGEDLSGKSRSGVYHESFVTGTIRDQRSFLKTLFQFRSSRNRVRGPSKFLGLSVGISSHTIPAPSLPPCTGPNGGCWPMRVVPSCSRQTEVILN